jgi:hypothetical protein
MVEHESAGDATGEIKWSAYETIVEKRRDYYLARFRRFAQGGSLSWNWAALFATFAWLRYRKMYGWSWAYFFVSTPVLFTLAFGHAVGGDQCARALADYHIEYRLLGFILIGLIGWILPPLFANRIYFSHVRALVAKTTAAVVEPREVDQTLTKRYGTGGFVGALIVQIAIVLGSAVLIPSYANYSLRLRVAEGIVAVEGAREHMKIHGRTPVRPEEVGAGRYVSRIEFPADGTIKAVFGAAAKALNGRSVLLVPHRTRGALEWTCRSDDLPNACLPSACRGQN